LLQLEQNLTGALAAATEDERFSQLEAKVERISQGLGILLQYQGLDGAARQVYPGLPFAPPPLMPTRPQEDQQPAAAPLEGPALPTSPAIDIAGAGSSVAPSIPPDALTLQPPAVTIQPPTPQSSQKATTSQSILTASPPTGPARSRTPRPLQVPGSSGIVTRSRSRTPSPMDVATPNSGAPSSHSSGKRKADDHDEEEHQDKRRK
jgi:hypothetical protein